MKHLKFTALILLTLFSLTNDDIKASTSNENTEQNKTLIILQKENGNNHKRRPNAPSRQQIYCINNADDITISFIIPEGECACYITDVYTNNTYTYYFDSSELEINLNTNGISNFYLKIITENGNTYIGNSEINEF